MGIFYNITRKSSSFLMKLKNTRKECLKSTFCKPCSVLPKKWQPFIYILLCPVILSVHSHRFPYQIWVSRLWGLPVPSAEFLQRSSLWHINGSAIVSLRRITGRQISLPDLIDSASTNTTSIAGRASMDFPLTAGSQRLPKC